MPNPSRCRRVLASSAKSTASSSSVLTCSREDSIVQHRRWLVASLFLALIVPAFAQEGKPVNLSWKFEKDKTFYQEMTTETKQTMKVMGTDVNQTQKQTFIYSWTPVEQDKDKNWVVKQKI